MKELIVNLHMHTTYSDGYGSHEDIARAALNTNVDVVIVTDHNTLVKGVEGYRQGGGRRVLLLVGEEIHDQSRSPQKNHLLVFGVDRDLATFAADPQQLLDQVRRHKGLAFIAHPFDPALPLFGEDDISWVDWQVHGYTGIELWNGFSELKNVVKSRLSAAFYAFFPQWLAHGPLPATLKKWDELLATGQAVVGVGGSDAHALPKSLGPLHRTVFPYEYHFQCINTHILAPRSLGENLNEDRAMVLEALRKGNAFIGYDLPAPTDGFNFTAHGKDGTAIMGEEIVGEGSITFQIKLPQPTECHLIKDGENIKTWNRNEVCTHITNQPGVYRVECYLPYLGQRRGWIFSNPIYFRRCPNAAAA